MVDSYEHLQGTPQDPSDHRDTNFEAGSRQLKIYMSGKNNELYKETDSLISRTISDSVPRRK